MDKNYKTVIGKDVIESLTIGMYDDSRFIYREYIQNAADQIDKARQQGLVEDGEIHISLLNLKKKSFQLKMMQQELKKTRLLKF
jgi:HSP90 family molecular chaperone